MSGSLTPSLPTDFYQQLLPTIKDAGAEFVVDTKFVGVQHQFDS